MSATGATETWRVVLVSGEAREVLVNHDDLGPWTAECPALFGTECGITPWAAVVRLTLRWPDRSREILAPGEASRAELIAQRDALAAEVARLRAEHEAPGECWYAYDPFDGCHKTFDTAAAAKAEAEACIEYGRDRGEWPEETDQVEWGRLIPYECATETNVVAAEDDETGRCAREGLSHLCDYELRSVRS